MDLSADTLQAIRFRVRVATPRGYIRKLRHQYSHYFDGKRLDDLVSIFTDDAICEFGPDYGGDWIGKAQIRTNYSQYTEAAGPNFVSLHAVTSHMVTFVDDTTAHGRCYLLDLNTTEGAENPLLLFGAVQAR